MRYTLFLDESGNINKNSSDKYFCIGGYLIQSGSIEHKYRMKKIIKNINKNMMENFNHYAKTKNRTETKFANLTYKGREQVFSQFNKLDGTYVAIIAEKSKCTKLTTHKKNDYYNYLVKILIEYIFEVRNFNGDLNFKELNIRCDNRSMKISARNDLQRYLSEQLTEIKNYSCIINVKLVNSQVNHGVMIADFIAGLCRYRYEGKEKVLAENIKLDYISKFPYKYFTSK